MLSSLLGGGGALDRLPLANANLRQIFYVKLIEFFYSLYDGVAMFREQRWRPKFGLRLLALTVAMCAVPIAWFTHSHRRQIVEHEAAQSLFQKTELNRPLEFPWVGAFS